MSDWIYTAFSNIGKRSNNQDFICSKSIKARRKSFFLMLVCDGVGGRPNGADCSLAIGNEITKVVASYLIKRKSHRPLDKHDAITISGLLSQLRLMEAPPASRTTASLVIVDQKEHKNGFSCLSIWGGDSRIYFIDQSGLCRQISTDHYNEEGHLSVVFGGDGKLHGQLAYQLMHSKKPLVYAVTSDGMNSKLNGLFKFFLACVFNDVSDNKVFESQATKYLGSLISDNYTTAMLYQKCSNGIVLNAFNKMTIK